MPHIVVTNDDGIHSPGLRALADALRVIAKVTIVAPLYERSAAAQSLTLRAPVYCDQIAPGEFAVDGTPADAMILAFTTLLKEKVDLVVSGINPGGNMGENIHYSGTVGAAKEASVHLTPAIAISLVYRPPKLDFSATAAFAARLADLAIEKGLPPGVILNVNVPQNWSGEVRVTRMSPKVTRTFLQPGQDPRGRQYFWITEEKIDGDVEPDTDHAAILAGAASVTPLQLDHTHAPSLAYLTRWPFLLKP
jgi:5'-nucleotidase